MTEPRTSWTCACSCGRSSAPSGRCRGRSSRSRWPWSSPASSSLRARQRVDGEDRPRSRRRRDRVPSAATGTRPAPRSSSVVASSRAPRRRAPAIRVLSPSNVSVAGPSRSPCTSAAMRCSTTQSSSTTSIRIRYGTGGATTPWSTEPHPSSVPSTRKSCNQLHHDVNWSTWSRVSHNRATGTGKVNVPSYSMRYTELGTCATLSADFAAGSATRLRSLASGREPTQRS